ncbi:CBN-CLEC-161 protein [Caenorhabditis brenneri]|uniref:CBN-CLEC-161 protein n=1 Tax=Caenorhabditis brenneri TaxID=135651 RepID=G0MK80_CAEBE|nr:CBN-CLEC-161 protein [Caenorhabditis brenneri]
MQRRTTIWFLLLFQPLLVFTQNRTEPYDCKIGSLNPLAATSLNACFKLYDSPKSYQAARRHCVSLGGQLADKINKDDSSLYSANADLEVTNGTKFWVGASNLKCNIAWENGGEIEYNEMWAPDSRYYGVAIEKMSLGGLWHTIPVGQKLPFVCTFQGKSKDAPAPVHAMRAPAKKRTAKVEKAKEDDIDESLNAALADEKKKQEANSNNKQDSKKDEEDINESLNAALSDEKKKSEAMALSASDKKESSSKDEDSNTEEASMSAQQALNASAAMSASMAASSSSSNSSSDESLDETYDSAEMAMRKEIGKTVVAMKSQEMASQSEDYDKYTDEDLVSAAASLIGGYTVNANWADSRTRNSSSFDSDTDEESMSMSMTVADQMAMGMQSSNKRESSSESSDSMSESSSDQMSEQASMAMNAAMQASEKSSKKSESSSKDESEDSASMSMEQKAEANAKMAAASASASKSESNQNSQDETVEEADVASAASIFGKEKQKSGDPKPTTKVPTTTEEPDIDESLNAALANQRSTTTNSIDLSTVLTTVNPINPLIVAAKPSEKLPGCPAEWTQFSTNATAPSLCFKRFEKPMNFEDARLFCVSKGGHLASIHNERQLLLLSALLHNNGPDALSDQTWIGLNRIHQKYYVYEDETPMDFTRWLPGAPNINDCTVFTGNELPNYPHKGTQYKFGDFPCEETQKSVLCEVTLGKDKTKTQPTCEDGWSYYSHDGTAKSGKCYKRIDQSKTFTEAREVCKQENSYVASVQNEGEARFVSALVQTEKNYTVDEQTWIGYVKYDRDFGWEDGNQGLHFDPWTEKMPREKKCTVFTGNEIHEDCRSQYRFVSVECNKKQRSILCSKPPMVNGVPTVFKVTDNSSKKLSTQGTTWPEAQNACSKIRNNSASYLHSEFSREKRDFVRRQASDIEYYIGLHKVGGVWRWDQPNGSFCPGLSGFESWDENYPTTYSDSIAVVNIVKNGESKWQNTRRYEEFYYFCETIAFDTDTKL